ncbi:N-carbamoylputrescine amidase [Pseudomonas lurida]|jgi:N-carbamoylputrescine amidase|uniref:nitrilase family protein n=1 Tax=Pseudomonas lurida TaxID=244566 RepID=UPI000BF3431A|nr:nitrilase family protein [Pseudomonas lurida]VVP71219.1 N-carbamoyl-D-amino acid hydrolase [Pseudomonas fluorescens]MBC3241128.1 hydratase [Pseudomonas lurida]MBC3924014.1 hydratase [Pseudomonas lurida]MBD8669027.1 nitrilase family protein [Pseudomonas lurida]PFG23411.1 putative amidohydrolase [Pseudomonas lurida]
MSQATSPVRVSVIQFSPQVGTHHRTANLLRSLELATEAANGGANLIVLPELSSCGYLFSSRQDAFDHAEAISDGCSVRAWSEFACRHQVYLVAGLSEIEGRQLFNTAVLLGPDGLIGKYRKAHLWNLEKLWFTPGDTGFPVFDTPIGRIGLLICWDIWFPEVPRILGQQGADIICSLNNWVWTPPPLFDDAGKCMASYLTMTAAHVNNVFIAAASRIGEERDVRYLGCSLIAGTNGWPIGRVASANRQEILYADIDLSSARSAPIWNSLNDLQRDRRVDLYDQTLGYTRHRAWPR